MKKQFTSILLHAGLPKTATTSIQTYCSQQASVLRAHDLHYPHSWPSNHAIPLSYIAQSDTHIQRIEQKQTSMHQTQGEPFIRSFRDELNSTTATRLLLSSEFISGFNIESLQRLKTFLVDSTDTFQIIIYLRHPVSLAESLIPTMLWQGRTRIHIEQYLRMAIRNYIQTRIKNLIHVFGQDAITIYTYEDARQHPHSVVGHFVEQINIPFVTNDQTEYVRNTRTSQIACDIVDFYNQHVLTAGQHPSIRHNLLRKMAGSPFRLSQSQRNELMELSKPDREWIYQNLGVDYRDWPQFQHDNHVSTPEATKHEIINLLNFATPEEKSIILDYILHRNIPISTDELKVISQSIIAQKRFLNNVEKSNYTHTDNIYMTCAAILASHEMYESAIKMLEYALIFNAQSNHLHDKINEYNQIIASRSQAQ